MGTTKRENTVCVSCGGVVDQSRGSKCSTCATMANLAFVASHRRACECATCYAVRWGWKGVLEPRASEGR